MLAPERRAAALLLLLLALPAPARAFSLKPWRWIKRLAGVKLPRAPSVARTMEFEPGLMSLGLQLGPAYPTATNNFDSAARGGPGAGLRYFYYPLDWIAVGTEVGYAMFQKKRSTVEASALPGAPPAAVLDAQADALTMSLVTKLNLLTERSWTPYLLGGAGYHNFSMKLSAASLPPGTTLERSFLVSDGLALSAGAGLEVFIISGASASFEARYTEYRLNKNFSSNSVESLAYMLGVHFWFGD